MSVGVFLAMLVAALLHATWNAWVKSSQDPYGGLIALGIGAGWPCVFLLAWSGMPENPPWGFMALTIGLSVPAQALLGAAYREGNFVVAYPVVRGLMPVAIAFGSIFLFDEALSLPAALGVLLVSSGIALLGFVATRRGQSITLRGLWLAGLSACVTALAVLADSAGARAADDPVAYASLVTIGNSIAMAAYHVRRVDLPRVLVANWPLTVLAPIVSTVSYLITIWSLGEARVALVIAVRETSILFALAIGALFLREQVGRWHALAVAIVFAGLLLIRG